MTAQDHHKLIGVLHLIFAGVQLIAFVLVLIMVVTLLMFGAQNSLQPFPFFVGAFIGLFVVLALFAVPTAIAGFGLLKRRTWGRTAGIVASVAGILSIPFGMALSIYTLWFLLGERGKEIYR